MSQLRWQIGLGGAVALSAADQQGVEVEDESSETKAEFRQSISVSANHPDTPSEVVKTSDEIETWGGEDLGALLRRQPGMEAVRRGAIGMDPQVRGLREGQLAIFVDGTRTFSAAPGRMDSALAHISPRAVEKLTVVKGPYALEWGAGAMAAIYLDTHRGVFADSLLQPLGRVGVDYGSNGNPHDAYVSLSSGGPQVRWNGFAQTRAGDDYEDGSGAKIPGDYQSTDLRWNVDAMINESWQLGYAGGRQSQDDIDYPGRLLDATYFDTRSHDLTLTGSSRLVDAIQFQVYSNDKSHAMNNAAKPTARPMAGRTPPFAIQVDLPASSDTSGGRAMVTWGFGDWSLTTGVDHYTLVQNATRTISRRDTGMVMFDDMVWPDVQTQDTGAYARATYRGDRWTMGSTIRMDKASTAMRGESVLFSELPAELGGRDDSLIAVAVSGRRQLGSEWAIVGGLGAVERLPSALERYADRFPATRFQVAAEFVGDPQLAPERSQQLDLGIEYRGAKLDGSISVFHRVVDDYITVLPDSTIPRRLPMSPSQVFRYRNGSEATFSGAELQARRQTGVKVELWGNLSWLQGTDEEFGDPAFGVPPLRAWIGGLLHATASLDIELAWTLEHRQDRVATSRFEKPTPGYGRGDLSFAWQRSDWHFKLVVENLNDKAFVRHLNAANPFTGLSVSERGHSVRGAVEWRF